MKKRITSYLSIIVLLILILIRPFLSDDQQIWIDVVNCLGLFCASFLLGLKILEKIKDKEKKKVFIGIFVLALTSLIIIICLVFTGAITVSTKAADEIMLITLLLSLPTDVYLSWVKD